MFSNFSFIYVTGRENHAASPGLEPWNATLRASNLLPELTSPCFLHVISPNVFKPGHTPLVNWKFVIKHWNSGAKDVMIYTGRLT